MSGHSLISLHNELERLRRLIHPFLVISDRLNRIEGAVNLHNGKMGAVGGQAVGGFDFAVQLLMVSEAGQPNLDHSPLPLTTTGIKTERIG